MTGGKCPLGSFQKLNPLTQTYNCRNCPGNCSFCNSFYQCWLGFKLEGNPLPIFEIEPIVILNIPIKYQFTRATVQDIKSPQKVLYDCKFSQFDGSAISITAPYDEMLLSQASELPEDNYVEATNDIAVVKIEPSDQIVKVYYRINKTKLLKENTFEIEVEFTSPTAASKAGLTFSLDHPIIDDLEKSFGKSLMARDIIKVAPAGLSEPAAQVNLETQAEIDQAESLGSILSGLDKIGAIGGSYISYLASLIDFDPSGHLMKLSQMNKLYSRFKFLDFRQGLILGKYFKVYGEKFDPESASVSIELN